MARRFIRRSDNEMKRLTMKRLMTAVLVMSAPFAMAEDFTFFESKVRPLLTEQCMDCHGDKKQKGRLRLDSRAGWQKGGDSGAALVPGRPEDSLLIKAVSFVDKDLQMPPKKQLAPDEVAVLKEWVKQGAPDPRVADVAAVKSEDDDWEEAFRKRLDWWSLKPPGTTQPPQVRDVAWSREPVDRFIRARLDAEGLIPALAAEPEVLLRRLSLVLTGLPPRPEQRESFLQHWQRNSAAAYEALVDEMLSSPHFGERFARHWMDVVRYTDTYGYEWDNPAKGAHEYRDYVIRAFNDDIGYDQFLREQLAGDLLPNPRIHTDQQTCESLIAPMFYHLGEHRHGSSLAFNGVHQEMVNNKIDAFSKAFLATTVACARCHDHKLEAVSQRDYYALAALFTMPRWTARVADAPAKHAAAAARLKELRDDIRRELSALWTRNGTLQATRLMTWATDHLALLESAKPKDIAYPLARLVNTRWLAHTGLRASAKGTTFTINPDHSILATGIAPQMDTYTVQFASEPGSVSLLKLEALTHASLPELGPGRTNTGNFVLNDLRIEVKPRLANGATGPANTVKLATASASHSQPGYPVESLLLPAAGRRGWAGGLGPKGANLSALFTFDEVIDLPHGGDWTVTLEHKSGTSHLLGCFRVTVGRPSAVAEGPQTEIWNQLAVEWNKSRSSAQKANEVFSAASMESWVLEGDGFLNGQTDEATPLIALEGDSVISRLLPQGWHSHALSSKLPGSLRMPPQHLVPGKFVSLNLAGGEFGGHLVVDDHAFQNEAVAFYTNTEPQWRSFADAELKNGLQQVAVEFCTSSLNPNFPPRTGLAKGLLNHDFGYDKRSWISVTGIVTHDAAGTPQDTLDAFTGLYDSKISEGSWERVAAWFNTAVQRWSENQSRAGDRQVLNWLLENGLMPNKAEPGSKLAELVAEYRRIEANITFPRTVNSMDERDVMPVKYPLNVRGNFDVVGELIEPASLKMLQGEPIGNRLELAESLLHPEHPLTTRVYVNRVWQWIFGTGLVATPDDFGRLGDKPSHPELLDWLAREFIREGWSTKKLVRRLVLSETFRQSGQTSAAARERDPANRLLSFYPTRRLEAESIRDSLLAVSGRLDPKLYGRPILPPRNAEDPKKRLFSGPLDGDGRRSIYLQMSIMEPPKFLVGFNLPDLRLPTGRRDFTNVPTQSLTLLNDPFVTAMAKHWATKLLQTPHLTPEERVRAMFVQAFGHEPQDDELPNWTAALGDFASPSGAELMQDNTAWAQLAHAFFNTTEFLFYR